MSTSIASALADDSLISASQISSAPETFDGVDAPFEDRVFESEVGRVLREEEEEAAIAKEPRGGTCLKGPKSSGKLNDLYGRYKADPTDANLNLLLVEVGRYATINTTFDESVTQSATEFYTELGVQVQTRVWRNLNKFEGRCKFSTWVHKICQSVVKDAYRRNSGRETEFLDEKDYHDTSKNREAIRQQRGRTYRAAVAGSADDQLESGSAKTLVEGEAPSHAVVADSRLVTLERLLTYLSEEEQMIVYLIQLGMKPAQIGERFEKNAKWASNKMNAIKKRLKTLAEDRCPKASVANPKICNVVVMKDKSLPASQAA